MPGLLHHFLPSGRAQFFCLLAETKELFELLAVLGFVGVGNVLRDVVK